MQTRNIILTVAGLAVLGGVALLLYRVKGDSEPAVSDEKRARALAEYERRKARSERMSERMSASADKRRAAAAERSERVRNLAAPRERSEPPPELPKRPVRERLPRRPMGDRPSLASGRAVEGADKDDPVKTRMAEATNFYDKGNYPAAQEAALEVLKKSPRDIKMLRVAVSTLCATGDVERASKFLGQLPKRDQKQMRRRCQKWGAELE